MSDPSPPGPPPGPPSPPPSGAPAPGWWQASDGNWYPPDQQPGYAAPPAYGSPAPGYGYGYPMYAPSPGTNGFAIASLIASIVSCGIGSILGVIFGHVALGQIKRTGEGGRGLAIAGLIIGYIGLAAIIAFVVIALVAADSDNNFDFDNNDFSILVPFFR